MILEHLVGSAFRSMITRNEFRGIILLHIHPRFLIWTPESKHVAPEKMPSPGKCQHCSFAQPISGCYISFRKHASLKTHEQPFVVHINMFTYMYMIIYIFPVFQLVQESCQQLPTTNITIMSRRQHHQPTSSSSSSSSSSSNININQGFPVSSWLRSHLWCRLPKSFQSATTDGPLRWFTDDGARGQRPAPKCLSGGLWVVPWYQPVGW